MYLEENLEKLFNQPSKLLAEEEPNEHLQQRQTKSTADQAGERSGPEKDGTPIPRIEDPESRVESEPVRTEPVTELPA